MMQTQDLSEGMAQAIFACATQESAFWKAADMIVEKDDVRACLIWRIDGYEKAKTPRLRCMAASGTIFSVEDIASRPAMPSERECLDHGAVRCLPVPELGAFAPCSPSLLESVCLVCAMPDGDEPFGLVHVYLGLAAMPAFERFSGLVRETGALLRWSERLRSDVERMNRMFSSALRMI